ncbi:hypothetical protein TWF506_005469 [Arthrobotrys conoides]|uniref:Uncharacterized protein n=1 Tax=Arthrobotrys conoides TaxID=74498 RepID=A0AAN8S023_9PEZI
MTDEQINFLGEQSESQDDDASFTPQAPNPTHTTELFDAASIRGFPSVPKPELPNTSRIMSLDVIKGAFNGEYWRVKTGDWSGRFEMDHMIGIVTQELKTVLDQYDDQTLLAQAASAQSKSTNDVIYEALIYKLIERESILDTQRQLIFDMLNATQPVPPENDFEHPRWFYKQCLARARRLKSQQRPRIT